MIYSILFAGFGKTIYKTFPAASEVNKSTLYNDRRKMGHFTWALVNNGDKEQLIVNLYVVHKVRIHSVLSSDLVGFLHGIV